MAEYLEPFETFMDSYYEWKGFTTNSGFQTWEPFLTSTSGINMMITDLVMLSEGLSHNLNRTDPYTVASGVAETDTNVLYSRLAEWNTTQNTIYSNYLYGKIMTTVVKEEPITKLKMWFTVNQTEAEIMWNLLNLYRDEQQNLDEAYERAVELWQKDSSVLHPAISNTV